MGPGGLQLWGYRALYVALGLGLIAYRLLPLGPAGGFLVAPDVLLALTLAWAMRQPDLVPIGTVVAVFLLADFLLQRPPGLWTALVLLSVESLRRRRMAMAEFNFAAEWLSVAGIIMAIILGERLILSLIFAPQNSLGLSLAQGLSTIAVYPIAVLVSRYLFGVRRLNAVEAETA